MLKFTQLVISNATQISQDSKSKGTFTLLSVFSVRKHQGRKWLAKM